MLVASLREPIVALPAISHDSSSVYAHMLFDERHKGLRTTILNSKEELATLFALGHAKHPLGVLGDASYFLFPLGEVRFVDLDDLASHPKLALRVIPLF